MKKRLLQIVLLVLIYSCNNTELPDCYELYNNEDYEVVKEGDKHLIKIYAKNGVVVDSLTMLNCQIQGTRRIVDLKKNKIIFCEYLNDTLDGAYLEKHIDGNIILKGFYSNGRKVGGWTQKDSLGNLSLFYFYDLLGNLIYKREYEKNKKYKSDGLLMPYYVILKNGVKIEKNVFGSKVEIFAEMALPPNCRGFFTITELDQNNKVISVKKFNIDSQVVDFMSYRFPYKFSKKGHVSLELKYDIVDSISRENEYVKVRRALYVQ